MVNEAYIIMGKWHNSLIHILHFVNLELGAWVDHIFNVELLTKSYYKYWYKSIKLFGFRPIISNCENQKINTCRAAKMGSCPDSYSFWPSKQANMYGVFISLNTQNKFFLYSFEMDRELIFP